MFWRAARAQVRARSQNLRQRILLINANGLKIYAILAQKAEILANFENWPNFKNAKFDQKCTFWRIFEIWPIFNFF